MAPDQRAHFLNNILNQNARQKQLIDRLLDLIRVEKQQALSAPEHIDLALLAEQVRADCAARLAARGQTLHVQVESLALAGEPLLLRQAIDNLLDNAIDFSPAGASIVLRGERRGERAFITVSDAGTGIPAFAEERLFERFYSVPRPDGARSTGLGLPFVREVMELHGGSVSVANQAGGGVLAVLELPIS